MYSYNDWRSYELYHASAFPGKGFVKGKNTPEYNRWYYMTHPEKWGVTKAAVGMYDKAKDFAENTETDLDDRFLNAVGEGANRLKTGLKNNSAVQDVRRSTEALQRRDQQRALANRQRERERSARDNAYNSRATRDGADTVANNPHASQAARDAASGASRRANSNANMYDAQARSYGQSASRAERRANQESANADAYARRARNTVGNAVRNTVGSAVGAARNAGQRILDATTIDEKLGTAAGALKRGNFRGAATAARAAGREAGERLGNAANRAVGAAKDAINDRIDRSSTVADDMAREAYRNLRSGNTNLAKGYARGAARAVGNDIGNAARTGAGAVVGGARALGQRALDATTIDERVSNAVGTARNHATNAAGVVKNTVQNYRGLAENNRQIAEQGYKYGQALANAQREYDASPNPNSKRMLDIAQRDYDNYTKGNRVAQIGAAAGRAGKSLNNAMNDVQRAVGNQIESIRDRNAAQENFNQARENEANARSSYNELARQSSNARGRMMDRAEETGDPVSAQNAFRDEISRRDARADEARQNIPAAQRQTREAEGAYNRAQDRYNQTPLGRAENAARDLKNSAGTAVEAKIEATKAVKDAVSDYWDAVDQYGANSPQAKAAAKAAEGKMSSAAVGIIGRFGNAKNTIEGVIEDGQEMMDRLLRRGDWGSTNPTGSPDYEAEANNRRNNR